MVHFSVRCVWSAGQSIVSVTSLSQLIDSLVMRASDLDQRADQMNRATKTKLLTYPRWWHVCCCSSTNPAAPLVQYSVYFMQALLLVYSKPSLLLESSD
eukprot:COSAG01_NODE_4008_length_5440_cov_3.077701_1_plen_99_part_00